MNQNLLKECNFFGFKCKDEVFNKYSAGGTILQKNSYNSNKQLFLKFLNEEFMEHVLNFTNTRTKLFFCNGKFKVYTPISSTDLEIWFAIHFIMGLIELPLIEDYWKNPLQNLLFGNLFVSNIMSYKRYLYLTAGCTMVKTKMNLIKAVQ